MNPILPGFYPDPSVCRVGADYYLVTSTFEYFPGVPVFHSRNLVHWQQVGHALTRDTQLSLRGAKSSQGIYAPTLRYQKGVFYLVTTNMSLGRSFYVTTSDPTGSWSDPIYVDEDGFSMDPSLFFDDDGKVYYTRHGGGRHGAIFQAEIEIATGQLVEAPRRIWGGTGCVWPEGPHLYKIEDTYYLLIAEGGTSFDHQVTVARSRSPWGPFEACPHNPILTHKHDRKLAIQATGHADLVQSEDGAWWMVFLGIRPWDGAHHHLGRETFLAPVTWSANGWPIVNRNRPVPLALAAPGLSRSIVPEAPLRDDFDAPTLAFCWNFVRNPEAKSWSLRERPGWLRLRAVGSSLDTEAAVALVGRRQQHYRATARVKLEFPASASGQRAGIVVRGDERNHYDLFLTHREGRRQIVLESRVLGTTREVATRVWPAATLVLGVSAAPEHYEFFFVDEGGHSNSVGVLPTLPFASEVTGGFTGVYFGMFAVGDDATPPADFDWFEYMAREAEQ